MPECGLNGTKPDFIVCKKLLSVVVVEAKNDIKKIDNAISEAIDYADAINIKKENIQLELQLVLLVKKIVDICLKRIFGMRKNGCH